MTSVPERRFGIIDSEATACLVVGATEVEGESGAILALPALEEHVGAWQIFEVLDTNGLGRKIRLTLVAKTKLCGLRKQPPAAWGGDYVDFEPGVEFEQEKLAAAYAGQNLDTSRIEEDFEMDDEDLRATSAIGTAATSSTSTPNPFLGPPPPKAARTGEPGPRVPVEPQPPLRPQSAQPPAPANGNFSDGLSSIEDIGSGTDAPVLPPWARHLARSVGTIQKEQSSFMAEMRDTIKAQADQQQRLLTDLAVRSDAEEKERRRQQQQLEELKTHVEKKRVTFDPEVVAQKVYQQIQQQQQHNQGTGGAAIFPSYTGAAATTPTTAGVPMPGEASAGGVAGVDLGVAQLPVFHKGKQTGTANLMAAPGSSSSSSSGGGATSTSLDPLVAQLLTEMSNTQKALVAKLDGDRAGILDSADPALGHLSLGAVKSARDRELMRRRMMSEPMTVAKEWFEAARREAKIEEGMGFTAKFFGERVLKPYFEGHTVLERMWEMLSEIHRLEWTGQHQQALAQTTQCLKAVAECAKNKGTWKGAWEYTYLPDLRESDAGIPLEERAMISKYLREKAAVEAIIEQARNEKPEKK